MSDERLVRDYMLSSQKDMDRPPNEFGAFIWAPTTLADDHASFECRLLLGIDEDEVCIEANFEEAFVGYAIDSGRVLASHPHDRLDVHQSLVGQG